MLVAPVTVAVPPELMVRVVPLWNRRLPPETVSVPELATWS